MAGRTTVHLVRHASYGLLGRVLAGRAPGHSLNDAGRAEASALARTLAGRAVAAVVTSPIERARETAAPIAAAHGLTPVPDERLTELDFGAWTALPFEALAPRPDWHAWNTLRSVARPPGGEAMIAAQTRALAALAALRADHPDAEVVVVSHADVIKAVLAHLLGAPLDLLQRIELAPASRSVVALFDADVRVLGVNLPPRA